MDVGGFKMEEEKVMRTAEGREEEEETRIKGDRG